MFSQSFLLAKRLSFGVFLLNALPQAPNHQFWLIPLLIVFFYFTHTINRPKSIMHKVLFGVIPMILFVVLFLNAKDLGGLYWGSALLLCACGFKFAESRHTLDLTVGAFLLIMLNLTTMLYDINIQTVVLCLFAFMINLSLIHLLHINAPNNLLKATYLLYGFKKSFVAILIALPLSIIIFIVFPRISTSSHGVSFNPNENKALTGISEQIESGKISELIKSNEVAFQVLFNNKKPPNHQLYFRGFALGNYEGNKWTKLNTSGISKSFYGVVSDGGVGDNSYLYEADYLLGSNDSRRIYPLDQPITTDADLLLMGDGQIFQKPFKKQKKVLIKSVSRDQYPAFLSSGRKDKYLMFNRSDNPLTYDLGAKWSNLSFDETIKQINLFYLNSDFTYSLSLEPVERFTSDYFLFNSKKGYCEHFSSSYAMLLRSANIPSRIVIGFAGGEWNKYSGSLTVRMKYAHAWVEAYDENNNAWKRIDPSKLVNPARFEEGYFDLIEGNNWYKKTIRQIQEYYVALDVLWNDKVIGYTNEESTKSRAILYSWFTSWAKNITFSKLVLYVFITLILLFMLQEVRKVIGAQRIQKKQGLVKSMMLQLRSRLAPTLNLSGIISEKDLSNRVMDSNLKNKKLIAKFIALYEEKYYRFKSSIKVKELKAYLRKIFSHL